MSRAVWGRTSTDLAVLVGTADAGAAILGSRPSPTAGISRPDALTTSTDRATPAGRGRAITARPRGSATAATDGYRRTAAAPTSRRRPRASAALNAGTEATTRIFAAKITSGSTAALRRGLFSATAAIGIAPTTIKEILWERFYRSNSGSLRADLGGAMGSPKSSTATSGMGA